MNVRTPWASRIWVVCSIAALFALHASYRHASATPVYLHKANVARIAIAWDPVRAQLTLTPAQHADSLQLDIGGVDGLVLAPVQQTWHTVQPGQPFAVSIAPTGSGRLVVRAVLHSGTRSTSRIAVFQIGTLLRKADSEEPVYFGGQRVHVQALPD